MKNTIIALLFLISGCSFAQNNTNSDSESTPYISVSGTASKQVTPDRIFIKIKLSEKTVNKKRITISEQETKLEQIVTSLNIDPDNLRLSSASSIINYRKRREKGLKLEKEYILMVTEAETVSRVFESLYNADIREAEVDKTENSNIVAIRKEVRIAAIKAAKDKAAYLLEAIGEEVGSPIEIKEIADDRVLRRISGSNTIVTNYQFEALQAEFEAFEVKFTYDVKFAIKQHE